MSVSRHVAFGILASILFVIAGGLHAQPQPPNVVTVLKGHTETIESVAVSPDGKFVATASSDKTVKLWDAATGKEIRTYGGEQGHRGQVLCVTFSAKGDQIATSGADNRALVWDVPVSFAVKGYHTPAASTAVTVTPDGKTFAIADSDGTVKIFPKGEEKGALSLKGPKVGVLGVGYLTNGNNWVTASADKTLRFFNGNDGKEIASYVTGVDVTGFDLRRDSGVFTAGSDGQLRFWQTPPQPTREFPPLKDAVTAFYSSSDGNTLLYATADKVVTIGSTSNNKSAGTFTGAKEAIQAVALSADNTTVAAGMADGKLMLWDRQGKVKADVAAHTGSVTAVAFHNSQPILFTAGADGQIKGWKLPIETMLPKKEKEKGKDKEKEKGKDKEKEKPTKYDFQAHKGKVTAAVFNSSTGQIITAGTDKLIRVWDVTKPEKPLREIGPLSAPPATLALTRDNLMLAAGVGKDVMIWTVADGKQTGKLTQPADVLSLSFSADKTRLLIGRSDNLAVLVEVVSGNVYQAFAHKGAIRGVLAHPSAQAVITASADKSVVISPVACTRIIPLGAGKSLVKISPNNDRVVSIGPGKQAVSWNAGNGQKQQAYDAGGNATAAAFSKDGQRIAVGGSDGSIKVYTVNDAKLIGTVTASAPVHDLAFQPSNNVLVGLQKDKENNAVAWSVAFQPGQPAPPEFGREIQRYPHPAPTTGIAFTSDGQFFTACNDKQVRQFRIAADNPVKKYDHPAIVDCVAFDDTGDRLATGCHDGVLRIYDLSKNTTLKSINAHIVTMPQRIQNPIYAVLWSNDHKQVFSASYDNTIKLWDVNSGKMEREFKAAPEAMSTVKKDEKNPPKKVEGPVGHRDQVFSIALSKDGKYLASGSSDKSVKLWDVATGKVVRDFENPDLKPVFPDEPAPSHPGWVHSVRFSPDSSRLITAGAAPRGRSYVAVWTVNNGKRVFGAEWDFGPIHAMTLSPDGTKMVIGFAGVPRNKTEPGAVILNVPGN